MTEMGATFKRRGREMEKENRRRGGTVAQQKRAMHEWEQREAARLRDQQRLMRAAFYQRHPEYL